MASNLGLLSEYEGDHCNPTVRLSVTCVLNVILAPLSNILYNPQSKTVCMQLKQYQSVFIYPGHFLIAIYDDPPLP